MQTNQAISLFKALKSSEMEQDMTSTRANPFDYLGICNWICDYLYRFTSAHRVVWQNPTMVF
jgi:hypothetical protein